MMKERDLGRNLIPLGEYRKPQFLFYDSESSQLYAMDGYNNNNQSIWIWGGIVVAVPILRRLSNTIFIHNSLLKLLSIMLAMIVSFIVSKFVRKKFLENKKIYQVDKSDYQNSDFYSFARRSNRLVIEGFAFVCIASVVCLGIYLWRGDFLFFSFFCMMLISTVTLIELNHLKRGRAIKQLKEES